jgi:hypothetical protein
MYHFFKKLKLVWIAISFCIGFFRIVLVLFSARKKMLKKFQKFCKKFRKKNFRVTIFYEPELVIVIIFFFLLFMLMSSKIQYF